ncbi:MAG TPA: RNA polymerase sigma factor [Chitinophagales bacterium]|nr:RNA polymerase sigma factor [Chitinophagales bacterium]HMW13075.1 RNA polymerase sigma factor [Chitinophagales bacterium]HMX60222.1 RNA polymerase sigma factor [Chitinophagales bacterium]HMY22529.1 RNA polymerase sigma factor [Chitinophagales bacterium]HMZ34336.1 RNA polymerase sigma factor [Chitinophagales bacterium]
MKFTDEEILALFKQSDTKEKAFRMLLSAYQERLYYHVRRYVHNHEDANDILQNTCIKVWNAIDNFRADCALYSWLYRIAGNEAITFINKQKKRNEIDIEQSSAQYRSASDAIGADAMTQKLQRAIDTLPDKQKQVFIMRYYDEMPYEKMAEISETSVGALKASYHHAVKKIEEILTA